MRILNPSDLTGHGNIKGREDIIKIMETGLCASDPYTNAKKLLRREGNVLYVGNALFEADGDPRSGEERIDLSAVDNIYVVGACKGVQRVALALEEAFGEHLTGGELIAKHGDECILSRIHVTFGAHPTPDEGCVEGCRRIVELSKRVSERDMVFTIFGNGGSSLLTLPVDGVSLEDAKRLTQLMQIEKGVMTHKLNMVRNHIDQLKGGKLTRLFKKAKLIHIIVTDANHHLTEKPRHDYTGLMRDNIWLHNLPEGSTFADAAAVMDEFDAWEQCPKSIVKVIREADPALETAKYEEFKAMDFRVFGIMPDSENFLLAAKSKAIELGYTPMILTRILQAEAREAAKVLCAIACNATEYGEPVGAPLALLSTGEMVVTVDKHKGIGGRSQEFALCAATRIAGYKNITAGSADTDGTDGPGGLKLDGAPHCLGGGIVDGYTMQEAAAKGVDVVTALNTHNTSETLWKLDCGMHLTQNISLNDLTVILVGVNGGTS